MIPLSGGNFVITLDSETVTITSITSSTTANGTYTVGAGQTSADLTASSIELSAGSLSDAAGNAMTNFTPATNLAAGSALVVDTSAPSISAIATSAFSGEITFKNATEDNNDGTVSITTSGVENDQTVTITLNGQTYTNTVTDNATTVTITAAVVFRA